MGIDPGRATFKKVFRANSGQKAVEKLAKRLSSLNSSKQGDQPVYFTKSGLLWADRNKQIPYQSTSLTI